MTEPTATRDDYVRINGDLHHINDVPTGDELHDHEETSDE